MNNWLFLYRLVLISCLISLYQHSFAAMLDCKQKKNNFLAKTVCQNEELRLLNFEIKEKYLNAQLMSNAPLTLLQVSQQGWESYIGQCKSRPCIKTQMELRIDDLTFLTTMNQSLTQHFIRVKNNNTDPQLTHIQLQQLDRNRIKVEGLQYLNPNYREANRVAYFRAYTSPENLTEITDLESKCIYQLKRSNLTLELQSKKHDCHRFVGIYRLYD